MCRAVQHGSETRSNFWVQDLGAKVTTDASIRRSNWPKEHASAEFLRPLFVLSACHHDKGWYRWAKMSSRIATGASTARAAVDYPPSDVTMEPEPAGEPLAAQSRGHRQNSRSSSPVRMRAGRQMSDEIDRSKVDARSSSKKRPPSGGPGPLKVRITGCEDRI
jgi:hypothetical protein